MRERVRITELLQRKPTTRTELGRIVFRDDHGRERLGRTRPMSDHGRRHLLRSWDQGERLTALKVRHILRLARHFGVSRVTDLFDDGA